MLGTSALTHSWPASFRWRRRRRSGRRCSGSSMRSGAGGWRSTADSPRICRALRNPDAPSRARCSRQCRPLLQPLVAATFASHGLLLPRTPRGTRTLMCGHSRPLPLPRPLCAAAPFCSSPYSLPYLTASSLLPYVRRAAEALRQVALVQQRLSALAAASPPRRSPPSPLAHAGASPAAPAAAAPAPVPAIARAAAAAAVKAAPERQEGAAAEAEAVMGPDGDVASPFIAPPSVTLAPVTCCRALPHPPRAFACAPSQHVCHTCSARARRGSESSTSER